VSPWENPENAEMWRDLSDQLSPEQIAELEEWERDPYLIFELPGGQRRQTAEELRVALLWRARGYASDNLAGALYGEVPEPAGATTLYGWDGATDLRYFQGTSRAVEVTGEDSDGNGLFVSVNIDGTQYPDDRIERTIRVDGLSSDDYLTLEQARRLGQALIDGFDEADELTGRDKVVA
jgi:hypothetical protein